MLAKLFDRDLDCKRTLIFNNDVGGDGAVVVLALRAVAHLLVHEGLVRHFSATRRHQHQRSAAGRTMARRWWSTCREKRMAFLLTMGMGTVESRWS